MFGKVLLSRSPERISQVDSQAGQQYLNWPLLIFEALIRVFPLLGFHNVGSFFAPVDAILVERAEHSVLLVDGVEERADMISPGEIDPGELY